MKPGLSSVLSLLREAFLPRVLSFTPGRAGGRRALGSTRRCHRAAAVVVSILLRQHGRRAQAIRIKMEQGGSGGHIPVLQRRSTSRPQAQQPAPAMDCIPIRHDLAKVCLFAPALAELAAPPAVRHHSERPAAMITDLAGPHCTRRRGARMFAADHDALARSLSTDMASLPWPR